MGALRLAVPALFALVLLVPLAGAQEPDLSPVGELANEAQDQAYPTAENQSGEDLTSEDIGLSVHVDVRDATFDIAGVMLGGGKAETTIRVEAELAIRAVNASRVEQALDAYNEEYNTSASELTGFNTSRSAVTADELRTAGSGIVLEAFQAYQEQATRGYLADTLPQVTILALSYDWQNTRPANGAEDAEGADADPEPRDPPLVLAVRGEMRFLDRYSLADLLEDEGNASEAQTPEERLREQLLENQTVPVEQQTAFQVAGIPQLVSLELPPGWTLNLTLELPKGYTISSATDALQVGEDRRTASYYVDGTGRETVLASSGVIKLSDRSLVTTTLVGLTAALGLLLRLPAEFLAFRWTS